MGIYLNICVYMCIYVCTHMDIHVCVHTPCGRCYWCNQSTGYFEVRLGFTSASAICVEGTGVTRRQEHLRGSAQFFRPFSVPWQSVIIDIYTYKEVAQG